MPRRLCRWLLAALALPLCHRPCDSQPYARFAVPDSLLSGEIARAGAAYEAAWNALLVAELRAREAGADSARYLHALEQRLAQAEHAAHGTRIGSDALASRSKWSAPQRRARVRAAVRESLAAVAQAARRWDEADSLFREALTGYRALGERRREAWVLGSIGLVAFSRGDISRADSVYRLALEARRRIGDLPMIGNTLNSLGSTQYLRGQNEMARGFLEAARGVREKTGERGPLGATLNSLGLALVGMGRPDSARVYFARVLEQTVAAGDSGRTADVLVNTMRLLADAGDVRHALELGHRAASIHQELGRPAAEASLRIQLGDLRRRQGRFAEATEELEAAVALARDAADSRTLLAGLLELGRAGMALGDAEQARPPLLEAARLADSTEDAAGHAAALNNLALLADADGDWGEAERLANAALDQARGAQDSELRASVATTLGGIALSRGDYSAMARWYGMAAADTTASLDRRATDLNNLAIAALYGGDPDRAESLFLQASQVAAQARLPDLEWPPLLGLGEVAERRADFVRSIGYVRRAVALIDSLRASQGQEEESITLLAERRFATEALIHLLTRLESRFPDSAYVAEAFLWAERSRARALSDLMTGNAAGAGEGTRRRPGFGEPVDFIRVRAQLPSRRAAFLEYSLGDSSSSLWVITRRGFRHFRLPPRAQLRARLEILRRSLSSPATAESSPARHAARALYRLLVEPAQDELRDVDRLIVSPDGALALIPFEALLTRDVEGGSAPSGAYLVSRFTISYVPSAAVYVALAGRLSPGTILALGNPTFRAPGAETPPREDLPALPHTAEELATLQRLAGRRPIRVLTGAAASRESLLADQGLGTTSLLHLATHGTASEYERRRAGLWLAANADGEPGFLSVADVLGLRLRADLVTLSACETGLGRVARGEGVLGLPRAFLAAGARSVLVTLWKVGDQSAAVLMGAFYQELLQRSKSAPVALTLAKRRMLENPETRSPFHWASFALTGRYPEGQ